MYVYSCTILRWSTCVPVFLYNTEVEYMCTCVFLYNTEVEYMCTCVLVQY